MGGRADHSQWVGTRAVAPSSDAEGWREDQFESTVTESALLNEWKEKGHWVGPWYRELRTEKTWPQSLAQLQPGVQIV